MGKPVGYNSKGQPLTRDGRVMSRQGQMGLKNLPQPKGPEDPHFQKLQDGRARANEKRKKQKEQRQEYQRQLTELRATSLGKAKERLDSGEAPDPLEVVQDIIVQLQLMISSPDEDKNQAHKNRELLLKSASLMADMLGSKPGANNDSDIEDEEDLSPAEMEREYELRVKKLKAVGGKDGESG